MELAEDEYLQSLYEKYKTEIESPPLPYMSFDLDGFSIINSPIGRRRLERSDSNDIKLHKYFFTSNSSFDGDGYYKDGEFCRYAYNKYDLDILYEALLIALRIYDKKKYLFSAFVQLVKSILHCIQNSKKFFSYEKWISKKKDVDENLANTFVELCKISDNTLYDDQRFYKKSSDYTRNRRRSTIFIAILKRISECSECNTI